MSANQLSLNILREFAPASSPLFAYRIESASSRCMTGRVMWEAHNLYRQDWKKLLCFLAAMSSFAPLLVTKKTRTRTSQNFESYLRNSLFRQRRRCDGICPLRQLIADPQAAQFSLNKLPAIITRECRTRRNGGSLEKKWLCWNGNGAGNGGG